MAGERYVVLGLARPRAEWFRSVGRWATSAALPAEFLKCLSVEELRARLGGGRACSAALLDGSLPAVDRDLVRAVREAGAVVLVVDDRAQRRDWLALGAAAVLPSTLTREALLDALATHATLVGVSVPVSPDAATPVDLDVVAGSSMVAAVCGPGGTGASTVAAALCQGLADHPHRHGGVLLADLARDAEQAMLHDVRDVVPGVQELVEAHRSGRPTRAQVEALTFHVVERGYHLLLGLRRARYWSTLRPAAFEAAFDSLRRTFAVVVCDVTADFEGDDLGGSADIEERNLMARTAGGSADVVFAVGRPGVKGLHALVRVLADLSDLGVPPRRIVPVLNVAPRHPRGRAELAATLSDLALPALRGESTAAPVFLPSRRVEEALRDAVRLPAPLAPLLAGAFRATVERAGPVGLRRSPEPVPVVPGSLGTWTAVDGAP
ncbi:MAG: ParA family protein [Actinomycetota bacterium]|nr:ParA family protein [Actinomycetota bacterium]